MESTLIEDVKTLSGNTVSLETSNRLGGGLTVVGFRSILAQALLKIAQTHGYKFVIPFHRPAVTICFERIEDVLPNDITPMATVDSVENRIATISKGELKSKNESGNVIMLTFNTKQLRSEDLFQIFSVPSVINVLITKDHFSAIIAKPSDSKTSLYFLKRQERAVQIPRSVSKAKKTHRKSWRRRRLF